MLKETASNQKEIREISGYKIEVLITENQIRERMVTLADKIYEDYYEKGKNPLFICVLRGAEPTFVWLTQELGRGNPNTNRKPVSAHQGYIGLSSYKEGEISGELENNLTLTVNVEGKDIVIVEDIVDSGKTMKTAIEEIFTPLKPKSIEIATLLNKAERREVPIEAKYIGFEIPNKFVVGFGLDLNEIELRNLTFVGVKID